MVSLASAEGWLAFNLATQTDFKVRPIHRQACLEEEVAGATSGESLSDDAWGRDRRVEIGHTFIRVHQARGPSSQHRSDVGPADDGGSEEASWWMHATRELGHGVEAPPGLWEHVETKDDFGAVSLRLKRRVRPVG